MDKRASLRQHFDNDKANKEADIKYDKMHSEKLARFDSVEETIANAFGSLLNFMDKKISKVELTNQLDSIRTPDTEKVVDELKNLSKMVLSTKTDQKPVIDALNALKREITLLPAKIPQPKDQKDSIKVSNLSEVKLDTTSLEKAIKALDLKVEAPIINIDKPDSYKDELKNILKAIQSIVIPKIYIPEQLPTDTSKIEKKLDESNKHLKTISEKKFGGGGGGGNGSPYTDTNGITKNVILTADGKIPVEISQEQIIELLNQIVDENSILRGLLYTIANPSYVDKSANQMRAQVTGSLTTVTNLTNLGSFPADHLQRMDNMTAWATNNRSLIA